MSGRPLLLRATAFARAGLSRAGCSRTVLARRLLAHLVFAGAFLIGGCAALPAAKGGPWPSLVGPAAVEGWRSKHALFYIVPLTGDGGRSVLLFDTGYDDDGDDLLHAVAGRQVEAVFITHGHVDHYAGAHVLGRVPTFAGHPDLPLIKGDALSDGLLPNLGDRFLPHPRPPLNLRGCDDGDRIESSDLGARGDWSVEAIAMPGHTPGSTAYLFDGLLFTGDAVLGAGEDVGLSPSVFSGDQALAAESIKTLAQRIKGRHVTQMFDGHGGRTEAPTERLARFVSATGEDR